MKNRLQFCLKRWYKNIEGTDEIQVIYSQREPSSGSSDLKEVGTAVPAWRASATKTSAGGGYTGPWSRRLRPSPDSTLVPQELLKRAEACGLSTNNKNTPLAILVRFLYNA